MMKIRRRASARWRRVSSRGAATDGAPRPGVLLSGGRGRDRHAAKARLLARAGDQSRGRCLLDESAKVLHSSATIDATLADALAAYATSPSFHTFDIGRSARSTS
jgi:hypothetical protein